MIYDYEAQKKGRKDQICGLAKFKNWNFMCQSVQIIYGSFMVVNHASISMELHYYHIDFPSHDIPW